MTNKPLPDPYVLVAQALGCDKETLNPESGLNRHPDWDSFGHLNVLLALEKEYGLTISDETVTQYSDMGSIRGYYDRVKER